jgi:hypothetical protein
MTKLTYNTNNLTHTIEGSKDDILAELIDIVTDDMTIVIDNLVTVKSAPKPLSKPSSTLSSSTPKKKRRTPRYSMPKSEYATVRQEVLAAWDTGNYSHHQIYRMFPKVAKSTLGNWIRYHVKSTSSSVTIPQRKVVQTSQINSPAAQALNKLLSKEA